MSGFSPSTAPNSGAAPMARSGRRTAADGLLRAAGLIPVTKDGYALFLLRSDNGDHAKEWCFAGGGIDENETNADAARRELREETGYDVGELPITLLHQHELEDVHFTTFECMVEHPFIPRLNKEHLGFAWAPLDNPPQPLHPGCKKILSDLTEDAANEYPESKLKSYSKSIIGSSPPGGTSAVNIEFAKGGLGAGKELKASKEAQEFVKTRMTKEDRAKVKQHT